MADLLSAMIARSKQAADPIASSYASGNRPFHVRVTRPNVNPSYDRATQVFTNPPDQLVYDGPGRLTTASGPVEVSVGDEQTFFSTARLSIDAGGEIPRRDDLVLVLSDGQSNATHLAGRVFTVQDVEVGGHFGIGYVMSVLGAAPSRSTV